MEEIEERGGEVGRSQEEAKRDSGRLGTTRAGATGKSNIEAAGGTMTGLSHTVSVVRLRSEQQAGRQNRQRAKDRTQPSRSTVRPRR